MDKTVKAHLEDVGGSPNDLALEVLDKTGNAGTVVDKAAERRVVRKIDLCVIPFICITYLVTYIDKTTLSYAAIFGLKEDLDLSGKQYSWLGSLFYFGYLAFEYPTSFAMQKWSVSKWLSVNILLWSGITMALGGCSSFSSFAALRVILGALESCSTPAYLLLTATWYKIEEQPIRIGYWSTFLGLANAFGGLIAYGIGHIHGALESWRYQFILVGAFSAAWGVFMFFFLADAPTNARWLSAEEKRIAVSRLISNQYGIKETRVKLYQVREALLDPKTWFYVLFGLATQVVNGSQSNFGTLIIKGFGYSSLKTTLLQIPYGFIIVFANLSAMYIQQWIPGQRRCMVAAAYVLPALAGAVGIHTIPRHNRTSLLVCYWLTSTYTASFAMIMSLITANTAGSTKRTVVNAMFFISYCVGNIIGPFAFKSSEAPEYTSGITAMLSAYCVEIVALLLFAAYAAHLNARRERARCGVAGVVVENGDGELAGLSDQTDSENTAFRFTY